MNTNTQNRRGRGGSTTNRRRPFNSTQSGSKQRHGGFRGGKPQSGRRGPHGRSQSGARRGGNRGGGRKIPTFDPTQFINTNPVEVNEEVYTPKHSFATFGFREQIAHTVRGMGLVTPTPIQDQIIPEILNGNDVVGVAETGTGKTAAFLLPLIEKTLDDQHRQTLILAPTRELAVQIEKELRLLSGGFKLHSVVCVGGMGISPQIRALKRKNHFVIGTPGRVLDLINRKCFNPKAVTTVVLDEADRMLDMGFIHDMKKILGATPVNRETLLFSATMANGAKELAQEFLSNPVTVSVKKKDVTNSIEQDVVHYSADNKFDTLTGLLADPEFRRVIVFGAMKHKVEKLSKMLTAHNIKAVSIHGNKTHGQRQRALAMFKSGNARVLVATDVAARGIHVDNVSHVINFDLPTSFDDYVHRIGRTGRGTKRGKALTLVQSM